MDEKEDKNEHIIIFYFLSIYNLSLGFFLNDLLYEE